MLSIYTPNVGGILSGITHDTMIKLAHCLGLKVIEADISLYDAYQAEETFFTGTAAEVTAIRSINNKHLGRKDMGNITFIIKNAYLDVVHGKNKELISYLTGVFED